MTVLIELSGIDARQHEVELTTSDAFASCLSERLGELAYGGTADQENGCYGLPPTTRIRF